jgi:hypothetical protein
MKVPSRDVGRTEKSAVDPNEMQSLVEKLFRTIRKTLRFKLKFCGWGRAMHWARRPSPAAHGNALRRPEDGDRRLAATGDRHACGKQKGRREAGLSVTFDPMRISTL